MVPIGYADGLPRLCSNGLEMLVRGQRAPIVGRVCMDMCMVDVTDIPGVQPGDVATVYGSDGDETVTVEAAAERAGTIQYELLCVCLLYTSGPRRSRSSRSWPPEWPPQRP